MNNKHTPGPWKFAHPKDYGAYVNGLLGVAVAWCSTASTANREGSYHIDTEEAHANARLIAAAPEMLDVLEWMEWSLPGCPWCRQTDDVGHTPDCRLGKVIQSAKNE